MVQLSDLRLLEATLCSFALRPGRSLTLLIQGFVNRLQRLSHLKRCYSSYWSLIFNQAGLSPAETSSLCWTHRVLDAKPEFMPNLQSLREPLSFRSRLSQGAS
ncbi:TPA: hypothetical protein ACTZ6X_003036 [Legionella pneumophila]